MAKSDVDAENRLQPSPRTTMWVIKKNPGEHFSDIPMIFTMFSLRAHEKLIPLGRGSRTAGG